MTRLILGEADILPSTSPPDAAHHTTGCRSGGGVGPSVKYPFGHLTALPLRGRGVTISARMAADGRRADPTGSTGRGPEAETQAEAQGGVFTVFTATYNRAHVLHRVYHSLRAQDLSGLRVAGGGRRSTDGPRALAARWRAAAGFPTRYRYQENRGKHVAYNHAVPLARGRFFLTLDSDDACVPQALARLNRYWEEIPEREKPRFSAVTVLCMDAAGRVVGDRFPPAHHRLRLTRRALPAQDQRGEVGLSAHRGDARVSVPGP